MSERRRILIVGCGAIGSIFAALLDSVAKVVAFDANADHVRAIRERGLRVVGATAHGATGRASKLLTMPLPLPAGPSTPFSS